MTELASAAHPENPRARAQCIFCDKFSSQVATLHSRAWYDMCLVENDEFVAVPALGQIVPGYLLVIPREHAFSMAQFGLEKISRLRAFCLHVASLQLKHWDWPVIFEHGACDEESTAGCCVNHAHWHLVPGNWSLLPSGMPSREVGSFELFVKQGGGRRPYLLFEDQSHRAFILDGVNAPSQLFRRELARAIGHPDEWDYEIFPFFENIAYTIEQLTT